MIKLIVTDMDGTFLDDKKRIHPDTELLLTKLKEMGVRFVVASGRQYPSLQKLFPNHWRDLMFVAQNGAVVMENGVEVISYPMLPEDIKLCLDAAEEVGDMLTVVCGKQCEYTTYKGAYDYFTRPGLQYEIQMVECIEDYLDDGVKLNFILEKGQPVQEVCRELEKRVHKGIYLAPSGFDIIDVGAVGINKGTALVSLQKEWGITPEETAVFGDQFNDVEMLQLGKYSYAMEGSAKEVQKFANFQGGDNNDGFVVKEICRLLDIDL